MIAVIGCRTVRAIAMSDSPGEPSDTDRREAPTARGRRHYCGAELGGLILTCSQDALADFCSSLCRRAGTSKDWAQEAVLQDVDQMCLRRISPWCDWRAGPCDVRKSSDGGGHGHPLPWRSPLRVGMLKESAASQPLVAVRQCCDPPTRDQHPE